MCKYVLTVMILFLTVANVKGQAIPENPEPGMCYVRCITPDEFREVTETIVITPSYTELRVIPATFREVTERVVVREETVEYTYVPAVYETVQESYVSKEASTSLEVVPARFSDNSRTVSVKPATTKWEYTLMDDCDPTLGGDCMVACFVEYPEETRTFQTRELAADASTREIPVSGEQETYTKRVVTTPARVEERVIPAEYATITKLVVDEPARVERITVPAVTETVVREELVSKGGMAVWEEVDCDLVESPNILPILYEFNSAAITRESERIIDEYLLKVMQDAPNLRVEIMSHTDSRGNDAYNMALSQQRAQSVVDYLVAKGINRNRLVANGFGETRLKNRCAEGVQCSEAEHQENRRTEFRIIQ